MSYSLKTSIQKKLKHSVLMFFVFLSSVWSAQISSLFSGNWTVEIRTSAGSSSDFESSADVVQARFTPLEKGNFVVRIYPDRHSNSPLSEIGIQTGDKGFFELNIGDEVFPVNLTRAILPYTNVTNGYFYTIYSLGERSEFSVLDRDTKEIKTYVLTTKFPTRNPLLNFLPMIFMCVSMFILPRLLPAANPTPQSAERKNK